MPFYTVNAIHDETGDAIQQVIYGVDLEIAAETLAMNGYSLVDLIGTSETDPRPGAPTAEPVKKPKPRRRIKGAPLDPLDRVEVVLSRESLNALQWTIAWGVVIAFVLWCILVFVLFFLVGPLLIALVVKAVAGAGGP